MQAFGVDPEQVRGAVLTHPDLDHLHAGWGRAWPRDAAIVLHPRHVERAIGRGLPRRRLRAADRALELGADGRCRAVLGPHDADGALVFRFDFASAGSLGFATDIGRCDPATLRMLRDVDTLAIESNYCPRLQAGSGRPHIVIDRITGGAGHLSNDECLEAVRAIAPRLRVVLLHLSSQCNHPTLVSRLHTGAPYELVVSSQRRPTGWLPLTPGRRQTPPAPAPLRQLALFAPVS